MEDIFLFFSKMSKFVFLPAIALLSVISASFHRNSPQKVFPGITSFADAQEQVLSRFLATSKNAFSQQEETVEEKRLRLDGIAKEFGLSADLLTAETDRDAFSATLSSCSVAPVPSFPCHMNGTNQSFPREDDLHPRWSDIKVIAAFGDSITAGIP
jgi:hypothetical protein